MPPTLLYIARRAFGGCTQLNRFERTDKSLTWRGAYARANAFLRCDLECRNGYGGCHAAKKTMINGQMTSLLPSIKDMLWRRDGCQACVGTCVLA